MPGTSSPSRFDTDPRSATGAVPSASASLRYGLDIETDTTIDGLDPCNSAVVAVAVSSAHTDEVLLGDERSILTRLDELLVALPPGLIVTWNGASFDLPFLAFRARTLGLPLGLRLWDRRGKDAGGELAWPPPHGGFLASWGQHAHLDGYRLYCSDVRRILGLSCGLKAMARLVGLQPIEVDRSRIHLLSDLEMTRYVASDARLARQLVDRRMPVAASFADRGPIPVSPVGPLLQR